MSNFIKTENKKSIPAFENLVANKDKMAI